jgi:hypothetical protein
LDTTPTARWSVKAEERAAMEVKSSCARFPLFRIALEPASQPGSHEVELRVKMLVAAANGRSSREDDMARLEIVMSAS